MSDLNDSCPIDILVDIETEETTNAASISTEKIQNTDNTVKDNNQPPEQGKEQGPTSERLCGYLEKVNQGGIIKGSKTRWFAFSPEKCLLMYYRSPKDTGSDPVGYIAISNCSFTCTAEGLLLNSFQISSDGKTHILQACDQNTMLWWLQELQTERRVYNSKQSLRSKSPQEAQLSEYASKTSQAKDQPANSGLLDSLSPRNLTEKQEMNRDSLAVIPVLPRIVNPPETVGIKSANMKHKPITDLAGKSEIGNKMSQIGEGLTKMRVKPARPPPPLPSSVFYSKKPVQPSEIINVPTPAKSKTKVSKTGVRFSHLLDKVQNAIKSAGKPLHQDSKHLEEIHETLALVREEMELMKTSLESKEETIQLLKKELQKYSTLSTFDPVKKAEPSDEAPDPTPVSPSTNHQMRSEITTLKLTIEHLRQETEETKLLLKQQQEKTTLFQEMLQVKDGIVVQLTNELYEMENSYKSALKEQEKLRNQSQEEFVVLTTGNIEENLTNENGLTLTEECKKLKDEVEGYKLQNKFLNNEILELTHLRDVDSQKISGLHDKTLHQEAEHCQLQSKYFILLAEMDKRVSKTHVTMDPENPLLHQEEGPQNPNVVKQLIQEAVRDGETRAEEISASFRSSKYDKYGFTQVVDDPDESTFLIAASRLEQNATSIMNSIEEHDASVALKWQKFLADNRELQRNAEFKSLVRQGIPHDIRHKVWRYLVLERTHEIRQQLNSDGSYYTRLTQTPVAPLHAKQIDLDLLRTLPNNRFFAKMNCVGIPQLKRVLGAYSLHNPSIGYCQGVNRIAAVSLLYLSEEDSFWCLVAIVEGIMPSEYYSPTLTGSQTDQRVFRDLLAEKLPRLHRHFESLGIDLSLITFNWFLCLYCDNVPPETMFRIWDVLLNESSKVLFRFGLAFFKHIEEDILEKNDYMTVFNLLRRMVHRMYDVRTLSQIAFQSMNPFPMKKVQRLREQHMEKVKVELNQLDMMRKEFSSRRNKTENSDVYSDDDDNETG